MTTNQGEESLPLKNNSTNNEQSSSDAKNEENKQVMKYSFLKFIVNLWNYVKHLMNLKDGADIDQTIEGIKRDIDFKGHSIWILIASIFIASIGLNVNSAAAVIGAMLISPLMGPILGAGLAIGTNDFEVLKRSLRSFATAVIVSIITSTIYFLLSPISEAQSELLARTKPTILDVFIAIFGGLAGIIAGSRREKSNVIPGVAIATALMPPLCTAGYGLASGQFNYFFGAFYLFLLNSIFICMSTYLIVRYLEFPKKAFIDPVREKKVKRYIVATVLAIVLPSAWLFVDVIRESYFRTRATQFISENLNFDKTDIMSSKITYGDTSHIDIYLVGDKLEDDVVNNLEKRMLSYGLDKSVLEIHQAGASEKDFSSLSREVRVGVIEDLYRKNENSIKQKDSLIQVLSSELQNLKSDTIPFASIQGEIRVNYDGVKDVSYAKLVTSNRANLIDTIPTFILSWDNENTPLEKATKRVKIENWLKIRLKDPKVQVINFTPFSE
ncbi:MAG: TIGR00341 family protein [Crocinitomicaceae bacterium]|nr:TIGR00341 family protein [Crocinitomicaceae bacterium]